MKKLQKVMDIKLSYKVNSEKKSTSTRIKGKATPPLGAFPELYNCSFRCIRF